MPRRGYRWLYPVTVHEAQPNVVDSWNRATRRFTATKTRRTARRIRPSPPFLKPSRRTVLLRRVVVSLALWVALLAALLVFASATGSSGPKVSPLATYPGLEHMPALSPDGKRVAFAWTGPNANDPYRVYVKQVGEEAAQRRRRDSAGASDGDPVWTPDGRSILFFRRNGEASGIYQVSLRRQRRRANSTLTSLHGSPSQARTLRHFAARQHRRLSRPAREGSSKSRYFCSTSPTLQSRQLTFPPPESEGDSDPAYSHDGKNIVFQRERPDLRQVYVVPATGGERSPAHRPCIASDIEGLAWTVDDREILMGGLQLRRISASAERRSPFGGSLCAGAGDLPVFAGDLLVYSQAWNNANIWKLELRGPSRAEGGPSKLIASTRQQAAASFSPDGSQIAFQSDRSGTWEIWKSNRDGSNAVQLTHFGGPLTGTPRWSPDGRQIAFDSRAKEISEIYVIPADGGTPRQVTNNAAGDKVPAWSHDGKWLYYSSNRDGVTNIWKMPVDGGAEQRVTSNGGIYAAESRDGEYLYYSRSSTDQTLWRIARQRWQRRTGGRSSQAFRLLPLGDRRSRALHHRPQRRPEFL